MLIAVDTRVDDDLSVIGVRGEVDIATAPELSAALSSAVAAGSDVVVDLTVTEFIDSTGIRELARGATSAQQAGVTVRVVCPVDNRPVRRVLDLLGLGELVPMHDELDEALAAVGTDRSGAA